VSARDESIAPTIAWRSRAILLIPLIVFLGLAALFMVRLGAGDPSRIPSALIGHPAPETKLPPLAGLERDGVAVPGLDTAGLAGEVTVLNVWSSWCIPCREEASLLVGFELQGPAGQCAALSRPLRQPVRRQWRR